MQGTTLRNTGSIIAWLTAGAGALLLVFDHAALAHRPATIALQICAALLMVWARMTFGLRSFHAAASPTQGELVTHGPYRFVRNPIYASIILFVVAALIDHFTWPHAAEVALVTMGLITRGLLEEAELRSRYSSYSDYASRTARLLPFVL